MRVTKDDRDYYAAKSEAFQELMQPPLPRVRYPGYRCPSCKHHVFMRVFRLYPNLDYVNQCVNCSAKLTMPSVEPVPA